MVGAASEAKRALRRQARALREEHAADPPSSALSALSRLPQWGRAGTTLLYLPQGPWEPPTADLVADRLAAGRRVCVPAWVPAAVSGSCVWPEPGTYAPALYAGAAEALANGPLGIPEPANPIWVRPEEIDLFVVPGMLFDRKGRRLGHGKGYFDRILSGRRHDAAVVALAYPWQMTDGDLPDEPHDVAMDAVVFPDGIAGR